MAHWNTRFYALLMSVALVGNSPVNSTPLPNEQHLMLTRNGFAGARAFIYANGRPLERALFAFHFESGSREVVMAELAKFQNDDGGFASDLESDTRWSGSSPLGTMKALRILNEIGTAEQDPHVQRAVRYLLEHFDKSKGYWHALPKEANAAPHAPWWDVSEETGVCKIESPVFPTAEIAGYLRAYSSLLPPGFLERVTRSSLEFLSRPGMQMAMPNLEALTALIQSLPPQERAPAISKLQVILDDVVVRDPRKWDVYGVQPLTFINSPASPLSHGFENAISANLDYIISTQKSDGGWDINWSWGDIDPTAWRSAQREWRGVVTLENLEKLHAFRRFANQKQ